MHKRIFRKYYAAFSIIVAITVTTLSVISSLIIGFNSFDDQGEAMERAANKVATTVANMPKNYNVIAGSIFESAISTVKETINSDIIIFNGEGIPQSTTIPMSHFSYTSAFDKRAVDYVLDGQVYRSLMSFARSDRRAGFTIGVPVMSSDNNITGAVFITTHEHNVGSVILGTLMIYLVCGLTVLLIAFVVLFFITKKLTKPIYQISEAAHSYAQGDFSKRVDISRSHEFAPLASAFNSMADGIDGLEQMRRGFVADVSHELRTPMTTITGFVDGMLDGTIPPEQHEKYLTIVSEEVHRISRMVSSLLDVAKMQSGQMTYVKKPFDIVNTTGKALFAFEDRINAKQINLDVDFCDDSVIVNGDEDAIYRVIYNLLDNAVKFTNPSGNIKISIQTVDNKAKVLVRNTGIGISKTDAAHIFERFYKVDKSRSINRRGTGIGLYLVKNIIKEHGEDVILTSKEGEFAQFVFTLPIYND